MSYEIKNRIWIEGNNGTYLAEGRVHLLKKIIETGSITQAAKTMKMSYKKAWEIIDGMNKEASKPLVVRISGGKNGGGTEVTEEGVRVIRLFEDLNKNCQEYLNNELMKLDL
ncbi:MAG: winged helix-turn-helix domain-containing protein [Flavobacteriales bacterium]|nr:winged helix-turn-helix domain-containing protein [Flavobacteriales bacterium]